jgi:hypothetical protein
MLAFSANGIESIDSNSSLHVIEDMKKKRSLMIVVFLCLSLSMAFGQSNIDMQYEATKKHPFGQANPVLGDASTNWSEMIGKCNCRSLRRNPDQSWADTTDMVWEFKYVMNGTAIQDISWLPNNTYTSSIRQYHADKREWYVTFFGSAGVSNQPRTWEGIRKDDQIVLFNDQTAPNGTEGKYKITFSEISDEEFNWNGTWVNMDESFEFLTWQIWCKK